MSKFKIHLGSLVRAALQIGGTIAVIHPAAAPVVGALSNLVQPVGVIVATVGVILGQIRGTKTAKLAAAIDAHPDLPSAKTIESG